jgi:hypothetical protein
MAVTERVLVIGIDPHAVAHLGIEPGSVIDALTRGQARFEAAHISADLCLVGLEQDRAINEIVEQLGKYDYACVVVGGGIRKPEPMLTFFEVVINLIRRHAPHAAIGFNTNGENRVEAALRWLPESGG